MTAAQGALSAAERSMRSVFVGNIPYEATEEQLKDIFSEVGPVLSFRLVYDRETGKPKGYGFCEYKDQEMALSAMRNLNSYEFNGRTLRVDNAASEKSKEELKNLQASLGGPPVESPFGAEVSPEKAPEAISRVIASLPPEQLHEMMTEMKACIENNPNEARTLLIQNPQLAYALLQAQVVMKIIRPEEAVSMLHSSNGTPVGLLPTPGIAQGPPISNLTSPVIDVTLDLPSAPSAPVASNLLENVPRAPATPASRPSLLGDRPPAIPPPPPAPVIGNQFPKRADPPMPMGDNNFRQIPVIDLDLDLRQLPVMASDTDMRHPPMEDQDFRSLYAAQGLPGNVHFNDPRFQNVPRADMVLNSRLYDRPRPGLPCDVRPRFESRGVVASSPRMEDHRSANIPLMQNVPPLQNIPPGHIAAPKKSPRMAPPFISSEPPLGADSAQPGNNSIITSATAVVPQDQEKAELIMQVLQLTDHQIALLPPEQRRSIMILKEQISRSQQAT